MPCTLLHPPKRRPFNPLRHPPNQCPFNPLQPAPAPACAQVLENISKHQLADHLAEVLPTVQAALVDSDPGGCGGTAGAVVAGIR